MSNSEEENENFCYYGKPLEPYDEDAFPKRKPISVEDQIATDAQGRRRFHGAFTGGFSAGFFNTVGSLEGWKPQEFKSSREEKAEKWVQKPQDFMDEEDFGQFGIAPQVVKATNEFSTNKKRKKQVFSDGPIPGVPVLHNILSSGNETVGYMLLRNMRMKNKVTEQNELNQGRMYGCEIPKAYEIETMDKNKYETPEIYKEFFNKPKENTFGLGYSGLDKNQFSLFPEVQSSTKFVVSDKNKKISITGQAFGVGAFENDDEDIYSREDISKYDFELGPEKKSEKPKNTVQNNIVLDKFLQSKVTLLRKEVFPPPQIPHSFTGKHKSKRSRFDPIEEEPELPRNQINPAIRARYIGEESSTEYTASRNVGYQNNDKIKQEIIEKENEASKKSICEPSSLYLSDKFVSATQKENVSDILEPVQKTNTSHGTQQMRDAVKIKMFGPLTRITSDWYPCALLCKRFNVPEPLIDRPNHERKRTKNLIFEYQKYKEENQNSLKPGLSTSETPEQDLLEDQKHENIIETKEKPDKEENVTEGSGENIVIEEKIENKNTDTTPVKDITEKIDVEKNLDLFKAVFLSSDSESDDETKSDDKTNEKEKRESDNKESERLKNVVMSDELLTKIKPLKEGILSNIGFHKFSKPSASKEIQKLEDSVIVENCELPQPLPALSALPVEDQYGPKIPDKLIDVSRTEVVKLSSESEEEWVEKGQEKKKKHKKEKKHKKDKKRKKDKKEKRR